MGNAILPFRPEGGGGPRFGPFEQRNEYVRVRLLTDEGNSRLIVVDTAIVMRYLEGHQSRFYRDQIAPLVCMPMEVLSELERLAGNQSPKPGQLATALIVKPHIAAIRKGLFGRLVQPAAEHEVVYKERLEVIRDDMHARARRKKSNGAKNHIPPLAHTGEAACIAMAELYDGIVATDDGDALQFLREKKPPGTYLTSRTIAARAVADGDQADISRGWSAWSAVHLTAATSPSDAKARKADHSEYRRVHALMAGAVQPAKDIAAAAAEIHTQVAAEEAAQTKFVAATDRLETTPTFDASWLGESDLPPLRAGKGRVIFSVTSQEQVAFYELAAKLQIDVDEMQVRLVALGLETFAAAPSAAKPGMIEGIASEALFFTPPDDVRAALNTAVNIVNRGNSTNATVNAGVTTMLLLGLKAAKNNPELLSEVLLRGARTYLRLFVENPLATIRPRPVRADLRETPVLEPPIERTASGFRSAVLRRTELIDAATLHRATNDQLQRGADLADEIAAAARRFDFAEAIRLAQQGSREKPKLVEAAITGGLDAAADIAAMEELIRQRREAAGLAVDALRTLAAERGSNPDEAGNLMALATAMERATGSATDAGMATLGNQQTLS